MICYFLFSIFHFPFVIEENHSIQIVSIKYQIKMKNRK
jgi:hypothetical protein